jgi:hypothetical protein
MRKPDFFRLCLLSLSVVVVISLSVAAKAASDPFEHPKATTYRAMLTPKWMLVEQQYSPENGGYYRYRACPIKEKGPCVRVGERALYDSGSFELIQASFVRSCGLAAQAFVPAIRKGVTTDQLLKYLNFAQCCYVIGKLVRGPETEGWGQKNLEIAYWALGVSMDPSQGTKSPQEAANRKALDQLFHPDYQVYMAELLDSYEDFELDVMSFAQELKKADPAGK